jgi:hypothetical protein
MTWIDILSDPSSNSIGDYQYCIGSSRRIFSSTMYFGIMGNNDSLVTKIGTTHTTYLVVLAIDAVTRLDRQTPTFLTKQRENDYQEEYRIGW